MSNGAEGHIAYGTNRAEGCLWFWIRRSPSLWATTSEIYSKVGSISKKKKVIIFLTSEKLPLNDKDLYLYSVACDQNFKRLFDNDPLQYCRSSLVISESSRGPH